MTSPTGFYVPNSWYRTDDRSGRKVRSYDTTKEWNGLWIETSMAEERQPQDFVRGTADEQAAPEPRPEPSALYVGALITTLSSAAAAAATSLVVASTAGMTAGDKIWVLVGTTPDQEYQFRTTIATVVDATHLTLAAGLPYGASSGNQVADITAAVAVSAANFPASNGGGGPGGTGL